MSNTNDTDIVKLKLNDTFYTWYLKTNQVIEYINPINVYDVFAGEGLRETRTGTPGTVEFNLGTNPSRNAIDTIIDTSGDSTVILNISELNSKSVSNTSVFVFSDGGDQSFKVQASDILPTTINGNHTFAGIITVKDLIVNDGSITINNTGTNRDNSGIIVESVADGSSQNASFTFDADTNAWYSNRNLGLKTQYSYVTDSVGSAIYPFFGTSSQGTIDLQLKTTINSIPEFWSMKAEFTSPDSLTFAHYKNGVLVQEVLELESNGTNGSRVIIKDAIQITDILSSSPFTTTPVASNVPITDSTNGFLNNFVNRVKIQNSSGSGIAVGHFVSVNSSGQLVKASADSETNATTIGIVESILSNVSTVILNGSTTTIPKDSSGNSITLVAGTVYYLVQTATNGGITATKPSTGIVKPVGVATSASSFMVISDNASSSAITNAFSTIQVADTGETVAASGSATLSLVGGQYIDLDVNTNKQVIINSSISSTELLPSASSYSIYGKQTGNPTGIGLSSYSILARPLNGNISSVVIEPGSLVGRKQDGSNDNNPIESLSVSEALSLLGFSGNAYFNNITFQTSTSSTVRSFNASTSESFNIRAGNNITFTYDSGSNALVINSSGGGGGGSTNDVEISPLNVSDGTTDVINVSNLIFTSKSYVDFTVNDSTGGAASVEATISSDYLSFGSLSSVGSFNPGKTVFINGSSDGLLVSYNKNASSNHIFTISLDNTIRVNEVRSSNNLFKISTETYQNLFTIRSDAPNLPTFGSDSRLDDVTIKIKHFDDLTTTTNSYVLPSSDLADKCVSVYALKDGTVPTSYPFKFHKIIADTMEVVDINITGVAIKNFAEIITLSGASALQPDLLNEKFSKTDITEFDAQDNGVVLNFITDKNTADSSSAKIIKLKKNYGNTNGVVPNIDQGLVISKKIAFTNNLSQISPTIGFIQNQPGTLLIDSNNSYSEFKFENTGNYIGYTGIDSNAAYLKYSTDGTSNNTSALAIAQHSKFTNIDSLLLSTTIDGTTEGIKFIPRSYNTNEVGKSLIIKSVTNNIASIEEHFVVQPYTTNTTITDAHPINTLYYTV